MGTKIAFNAVAIEILDPAGRPTRNAQWPRGSMESKMLSTRILNESEKIVARKLGIDATEIMAQKQYPIYGRPLFSVSGARHFPLRAHAPLIDGSPHPGDSAPNFPYRPRAEPHDEDDEAAKDPLGLKAKGAGVKFPSGKRI
jgi:hypothetical protein